jgi:hypothetical protein
MQGLLNRLKSACLHQKAPDFYGKGDSPNLDERGGSVKKAPALDSNGA